MKRYLIYTFSIAALFAAGSVTTVTAQQNALDRQVEVVREYTPDVEHARKIDFEPRMADTVALRPEISYSVTPTPWVGVFDARPIDPISVDASPFRPERPFYLRVGLGAPWQTLGDLYATATTNNDIALGAYVNHNGRWAKLRNDLGDKERSTATRNIVGGYFEKKWKRKTLSVDVRDDFRFYRAFGGSNASFGELPWRATNDPHSYNDVSAKVAFGDSFTDFSKFNYKVGVSASNFSGREKFVQNSVGGFFHGGFDIAGGDAVIALDFDYTGGAHTLADYSDWRIGVSPGYSFRVKDIYLKVGMEFIYNNHLGNSDFYLFPDVKFVYDGIYGFVPYIDMYGSLGSGSYKSLSYANPYVSTSVPHKALKGSGESYFYLPNSSVYGFRLGAYGSITQALSYEIFAQADLWSDYNYFMYYRMQSESGADFPSGYFMPISHKNVYEFSFGGALSARVAKGLTIDFGVKYNYVTMSKLRDMLSAGSSQTVIINGIPQPVITPGETLLGWLIEDDKAGLGIPEFELNTKISYNWRDKFMVSVSVDLLGKRVFSEVTLKDVASSSGYDWTRIYENVTVKPTVNVGFETEYKVNDRFNIFLRGDNLANQRIYEFNHYPGLGINFMLGAKVTF